MDKQQQLHQEILEELFPVKDSTAAEAATAPKSSLEHFFSQHYTDDDLKKIDIPNEEVIQAFDGFAEKLLSGKQTQIIFQVH